MNRLGKKCGYHALTFGWLVDQLIRRIDPKHRSVARFFREEIAIPFGSILNFPSNLLMLK